MGMFLLTCAGNVLWASTAMRFSLWAIKSLRLCVFKIYKLTFSAPILMQLQAFSTQPALMRDPEAPVISFPRDFISLPSKNPNLKLQHENFVGKCVKRVSRRSPRKHLNESPFFLSMVDFHTFDRLRVGRESRESKDFHERKAYSCQRVSFDE